MALRVAFNRIADAQMAREAEKGMSGFSFKVFALAFVTTFDEARAPASGVRRGVPLAQRMGMHVCMHVVFCPLTFHVERQMGWHLLLPEGNSQLWHTLRPPPAARAHLRLCFSARPGHALGICARPVRRVPPPCYIVCEVGKPKFSSPTLPLPQSRLAAAGAAAGRRQPAAARPGAAVRCGALPAHRRHVLA